jgi:hypothetical protein
MFREAVTGEPHRPKVTHDNVMTKAGQGNSKAYTLARLSKESPELARKLRAEYTESMSKGRGAPVGNSNAAKQNCNNSSIVSGAETTSAIALYGRS